MEQALMKMEPEVIATPKGVAVNRSLVQPSLRSATERGNGTLTPWLEGTLKPRGSGREPQRGEHGVRMRIL